MDLEELFRSHNKLLDKEVENQTYLQQRIEAGFSERKDSGTFSWLLGLSKLVVLYGFIFLILIFANIKLINWLNNDKLSADKLIIAQQNPFQPIFPGSISQAYEEIIK